MDTFGKNDPYCIVTVAGESERTSTVQDGGSDPKWGVDDKGGDALEFYPKMVGVPALTVQCFDDDGGLERFDDLIGTATVAHHDRPVCRL